MLMEKVVKKYREYRTVTLFIAILDVPSIAVTINRRNLANLANENFVKDGAI